MLASFKLPAYEEVTCRPTTPPPPYSTAALLGGFSTLTLTGSSSANCTSCSCESSCLTSPGSSSPSATEASSPSQGEAESDGGFGRPTGVGWEQAAASPKQALFSEVELFESDSRCLSEGSDALEESSHTRHRRLTGDSGIEVGRGQDEEEAASKEEEEEGARLFGKGPVCSQPGESPEGAASPPLPV
ncbi:WW domain-binding protein 1 [Thamnophis elegans]|uniref:WW domain-binding protein 1 n=1 Tax=Thamnophis elegans TaxID=35005 RepID=UPI001377C239|nr:WW domain-binding protein 1 [Thamnophis elegans]